MVGDIEANPGPTRATTIDTDRLSALEQKMEARFKSLEENISDLTNRVNRICPSLCEIDERQLINQDLDSLLMRYDDLERKNNGRERKHSKARTIQPARKRDLSEHLRKPKRYL
ncbi:hypothetical protein ElyMa_000259100 [Elysia marginata]|uniref:GAT domain-containing protein n=1 Tax=Elysia marginata TaxID=1093978 RepID=A0AAV4F466_9GAST|nr:hypothetical protein ElyMa_000259100 [Elysia marginata]